MRRLFSYMPIVAVAVLFSLFSCQSKKGEKQSGDVRLPEISVAYPAVDSVVLIKSYPGYLTSLQTVDLVARVNGYLQQVAYTPGEIVKKGQLLFVIEPSQYEDAVEQAEAALKTAQAQYDYAENNYTRMKEAAQSDAISTIDLIQAESKLEQSRASVRNAEAALSTARIQLPRSRAGYHAICTMWVIISAGLCNRRSWRLFIRIRKCMPISISRIINI